jgi:hypothetical protein
MGAEPRERALEPVLEADLGLPAEPGAGQRDVGLADRRVVDRAVDEDDLAARARSAPDRLGEVQHRRLVRVADVHRAREVAAQQLQDSRR